MKLTSAATWVGLDGKTFPKNTLTHEVRGDSIKVTTIEERVVVDSTPFGEWLQSNGTPYANVAAVDTALKSALYV